MVDINKEIKTFWQSELVLLPQEKLANFQLPEETRQFLIQVGLPLKNGPLAEEMAKLNIKFFEAIDSIFALTTQQGKFLMIAVDPFSSKMKVGIEEHTGFVWYIFGPPYEEFSVNDFINSNIQSFLMFFQIFFKEHVQPASSANSELNNDKDREVRKIKRKFRKIDTKALDDKNSLWSGVVEEIGYGMI